MKMVRKVVGDDTEERRLEVGLKEGSPEEMALSMSAEGWEGVAMPGLGRESPCTRPSSVIEVDFV